MARIGTFEIYGLQHEHEYGHSCLRPLLSKVKVLKAEKQCYSLSTLYTAESELFDEVPDGADIPEYKILYRQHPDCTVTCEFKKLTPQPKS